MLKFWLNDKDDTDYIKILEEKSQDTPRIDQGLRGQKYLDLTESDYTFLKQSILFRNWDEASYQNFIDDKNSIVLKQFKYKEIIEKEEECNHWIFVLKKGNAYVWTRMRRDLVKKHQNVLEKYAAEPTFICSSSKKIN
jgi:hypothetical protein